MATEYKQFKFRRGTAVEWQSNPVLAEGEPGIDLTARRMKVGDGVTAWSALPWSSMAASEVARLEAAATALQGAASPYDAATATVLGLPNGASRQVLNSTFAAKDPGYDIVILAGQSNMSGRGTPFSGTTDRVNSRVDQWKTHGTLGIQPATEPLDMHDTPSGIGPGLQFARWYAARRLSPNRRVLLVPAAHGGTRITVDAHWRRGVAGNLYANMITQTTAALAAANAIAGTSNRIVGMLWCQGESDGDASVTGPAYLADFDAILNGVRTDLGIADLPLVVMTMMPQYLSTGTRAAINAVHRETPLRIAGTDVAVGQSGVGLNDGNHYDAAQQRSNGRAVYDAFERIKEGLSPYYEEFRAASVTAVTAAPGNTALALSWAAATRATDYVVEYRVSGASTWTTAGTTSATTYSLTGLTNGTAYDVRVTARAAGFTATPSPTASATPVAIVTAGVNMSALGAYSLSRRVVSNYSGPLLTVRRSSDNATADISSSSGVVNSTALASFIGSSDAFLVTLYDQSGAGKHVTQATLGKQPRIATGGTLITSGGKLAAAFDGADDILVFAGALGAFSAGSATALQVVAAATPTAQKRLWCEAISTASAPQYSLMQPDGAGSPRFPRAFPIHTGVADSAWTPAPAISAWDGAIHQMTGTDTGSAMSQWVDAVSDASGMAFTRGSGASWAFDRFAIGGVARGGSEANFAATFSELVVFGAALGTSDRQAGEANQKAFYGTP